MTWIGSLAELDERAGGLPEGFDPHRPGIDQLEWACTHEGCAGRMRRVPEVLDTWFDSGSMPFAQWHHPFVMQLCTFAQIQIPQVRQLS